MATHEITQKGDSMSERMQQLTVEFNKGYNIKLR